jgi:hypothetical protein
MYYAKGSSNTYNDEKDSLALAVHPLITEITPARTHSIGGLKSRVLKLTFLARVRMSRRLLKC